MKMRTLARQAVVFALLGLLVTIVGCLVFLTKDIRTNANVAGARTVYAFAVGRPLTHDNEPSPDGFVATLDATALARSYERDIPGARPGEYDDIAMMDAAGLENIAWRMLNDDLLLQRCVGHADDEGDCKGTRVHRLLQVRLTNGLVLFIEECLYHAEENENCIYLPGEAAALEKDYWTAYKKSEHETLLRSGLASLESGLWGFAGGIGIWAFYRLVRFAVKG
jgi:hypothetical protein